MNDRTNHGRVFADERRFQGLRLLFVLLCLTVTLGGCARDGNAGGDEPVSWPELTAFDEISFRAAGFAQADDHASVRDLRPDLLDAGAKVVSSGVPAGASSPKEVESLREDLASILESIGSEEDDDTLASLVVGVHPVVENLMHAAGMPHVHAHDEHDHDHDGDGHDHDHDHDGHDHDHDGHGHDHDHDDGG